MPARSVGQQRFMGLVHAVQTGRKSVHEVSPEVARAAKTIAPRDATEFASTKHDDLPAKVKEAEDPGSRKVAALSPTLILGLIFSPWLGVDKSASLESSVKATTRQLQQTQMAREQSLKTHVTDLQSRLQAAQSKTQAAEQSAQQAAASGQAAMAAAAQPGPSPPPAQVPYGQMLQPQQPEQK